MPLDKYLMNNQEFRDLRDIKSQIEPEDFDKAFNALIDYLNSSLVPAVNALILGLAPAQGAVNTLLYNSGNATHWQQITNESIADYTISLTKFVKAISTSSVLAADINGTFIEVAPTDGNQTLMCVGGVEPIWGRITADNIADRTINSAKIGKVLNDDHFQAGIMLNGLPNNSVKGNNFANRSITRDKIRTGIGVSSYGPTSIGVIPLNGVNMSVFNGSIKDINIMYAGDASFYPDSQALTFDLIKDGEIEAKHFKEVQCIKSQHIAVQTISDKCLAPGTTFSSSTFGDKLTSGQLKTDYFRRGMFTPEVETAFINKGCLA